MHILVPAQARRCTPQLSSESCAQCCGASLQTAFCRVLAHASRTGPASKTSQMATRQALPNASGTLDLVRAQPRCSTGRTWRSSDSLPAAWAASRRAGPGAPHVPRYLSGIKWPLGYGQFVGRLIHGEHWAIKAGPFVRRALRGPSCSGCRRGVVAACREDRFNDGIDRPTQDGCTFHRTAGLP